MRVVRLSLRKNMNLFISKDLILFNFSLRFHTDAEDIHNGLLADLITVYFINDSKAAGNVVGWKMMGII